MSKISTAWVEGIFVGLRGRSAEYIVIGNDGVYRNRTLKKLPAGGGYKAENLEWATRRFDTLIEEWGLTTHQYASGLATSEKESTQKAADYLCFDGPCCTDAISSTIRTLLGVQDAYGFSIR